MPAFRFPKVLLLASCLLAVAFNVNAQNSPSGPQVISPETKAPLPVAGHSALYCAGYIQLQPLAPSPQIVGAIEEQELRTFTDGRVVYINAGSRQGIKEGQTFQIIRPRGDLKGVHRQKQGFLGTFIQEVGQLQVFNVSENVSAAEITSSCGDMVLLGDLVTAIPDRDSPVERADLDVNRYAPSTGKQFGRLMMAKDAREMVTRNDVVYIDLGVEDNVKAGDYLTIYRPLGTGNLTRVDNEEMGRNRSDGFQSDRYRGGGYSSLGMRAKDNNAFVKPDGRYNYKPVTTREIKGHRPEMPRKIVGEMVIIGVQTRTATAIITRTNGEVHTGDWVEIQ